MRAGVITATFARGFGLTAHGNLGSQLTCMGLFLSSDCFWVFLTVLCSERERPFFVPSPAIRFPERAEGVKGPKRLAELGGVPP